MRGFLTAAAVAAAFVLVGSTAAFAASNEPQQGQHVLPNVLADRQNALREAALKLQLAGKIPADAKVANVGDSVKGKGQYVKLQQTGSSKIFVILAEFGNQKKYGGTDGPLHNAMTPPNRATDDTTIWYDNPNGGYTPELYQNLYFNHNPAANSVANYYLGQSNGQFTFDGAVTNWVKVPYNEARYGTDLCGSTVCTTVWALLRDAANQWVSDKMTNDHWTLDQIKAYLATYDVEDRYDYNENGNFNEPDHYIDHFQLLHAGADEAVGGGAQGTDAIWSHRWYAWQGTGTVDGAGPAGNQGGGFEIGAGAGVHTGYWVGDYLMIPENSGVGVISHETGHDYGLPDEYDTTYAGESSATWWTIMSQGSYGGDNTNGIGNRPVDFDAWDKWQLGWLDPIQVDPLADGKKTEIKLGPSEYSTKKAQAVFVKLPAVTKSIKIGVPPSATHAWYSGMGDDYKAALTRSVTVPAGTTTMTYKTWYEAEYQYDYGYLQASTDGGSTWTNLAEYTGTSGAPDTDAFGYSSTPAEPSWIDQTIDLSPYAGQTITLRYRYIGDPGVTGRGIEVDNILIKNGATTILSDDVEGADNSGWTPYNFRKVANGDDVRSFDRAYVVENRQYVGYDTGLKTSPYVFSKLNDPSLQNWVDHYAFQDGVLISLWDSSFSDNNVGVHPGQGQILPIDTQQNLIMRPTTTAQGPGCTGTGGSVPAAARYQVYDAPLSTEATDPLAVQRCSIPFGTPSHAGVTTFDDRNDYTYGQTGAWLGATGGVITPKAGIQVQLKNIDGKGFANIAVSAAK